MKRKTQFDRAKSAAEKLLQKRLKQRTGAISLLRDLDIEIPNLERTIRALDAQLNSKEVMPNEAQPIHREATAAQAQSAVTGDHRAETSDIPAEVLAQLPPDYLEPYKPVEDDSLPEIEGRPLTKDS